MKSMGILFLLIILFILPSCGQKEKQAGKTKKIVASFYPVYMLTRKVADGVPGVEVINMTRPQTGCLHDYTLAPQDLKALENASIFVVNGLGMESFLEKVISNQPGLKIITAGKGIVPIKDRKGAPNPHVWVGISGAIAEVRNIGLELALLDPANSKTYLKNTDDYITKLSQLKLKMHKTLDGLTNRNIITFHEAFPYFAAEFNLNIAAVIEREPGSEPSASELARTVDTVRKLSIKALFAEPQYPARSAEILARETGSTVYTLDPFVTESGGHFESYEIVMEKNMKVLADALK
jgi:zinc transport system substrate-binding protein